jgi:hypothetical protein
MSRSWPYLRRSLHVCDRAPDLRIVFNNRDVRVTSLLDLPPMVCCPFCGKRIHDMTRERDEKYRRRAHVAQPTECAAEAVHMMRRLTRPNHPPNGIVSHFGVHRGIVSVSSSQGLLQVVMTQSLYRRPASLHRARAEAVAAALTCGIRDTWNGKDGSEGISVVLDRSPPEALVAAQANYCAQRDVFRPTKAEKAGWDAFREWYDAPLEVIA